MMGDPLGSSRVSSQKQNREGVVGAQSGQYRATVVERARDVVDPGPDVTISYQSVSLDGNVPTRTSGPLKGWIVRSHIAQGVILICIFPSLRSVRPFWELIGFGFHGNSEVKRVAHESLP